MPAKAATPRELFEVFMSDRLVVHTMPVEIALNQRPKQLSSNKSQLKCGSIFFWKGLQHQDGHHIPNAVARFGDPDKAERTVFATLHDLAAVYQTHEQLEQQKPPDKQRGPPFVLFSNSDIGNLVKEQTPPDDYMDAVWDETQPKQCLRPLGFNFREYCSTKREKDDPSMEQEQVEWNELRAVLNRDDMVGLLYIHDPKYTPEQHADEAQQLMAAFDNHYSMCVFKLKDAGGVQGDLLTVDGRDLEAGSGEQSNPVPGSAAAQAQPEDFRRSSAEQAGSEGDDADDDVEPRDQQQGSRKTSRVAAGGVESCRLMTFEEYLQQRAAKKHQ